MDQINVDALTKKSADWATYVKTLAENPAIAATYHGIRQERQCDRRITKDTAGCRYTIAILCITAGI